MTPSRAVGIVLAAGASRRMGTSKPLLPLDGQTYLERVLAGLQEAGLARPVVVLGHGAAAILRRVSLDPRTTVIHEGWARGMLSSLQAGLVRAARTHPRATAAVVAPVDVPRFVPATVVALLEGYRRQGAPIVVPQHRGHHGHPVLFGHEVWPELLSPHPGRGARAVVDAHRDELLAVPVDDPWVLRDADTPRDHERMLAAESADDSAP